MQLSQEVMSWDEREQRGTDIDSVAQDHTNAMNENIIPFPMLSSLHMKWIRNPWYRHGGPGTDPGGRHNNTSNPDVCKFDGDLRSCGVGDGS